MKPTANPTEKIWTPLENRRLKTPKNFDEQVKLLAARPGLHKDNASQHAFSDLFIQNLQLVSNAVGDIRFDQHRNVFNEKDNLTRLHGIRVDRVNKVTDIPFKKGFSDSIPVAAEEGWYGKLPQVPSFINQACGAIANAVSRPVKNDPLTLPLASAAPAPEKNGVAKDMNRRLITVSNEDKIAKIIAEQKKELINLKELSKEDAENFEIYMRMMASGNPVVLADMNNGYQNTYENDKECKFYEQLFNDKGEVSGHVISLQNRKDSASIKKINDILSDNLSTNNNGKAKNLLSHKNLLVMGMPSHIAELVIEEKRKSAGKSHDKNFCKDDEKFHLSGIARATDLDFVFLQPSLNLPEPKELSEAQPADNLADYYTYNPLTGVRTDILLKIKQAKGKEPKTPIYLKATSNENEYITYTDSMAAVQHQGRIVTYDPESKKWFYKNDGEEVIVLARQGDKKINLYGSFYQVHEAGEGKLVIRYFTKEGLKESLPVFRNPLSNTWHADRQGGHAAFSYAQENLIDELSVDIEKKSSYREMLNNNPSYYGNAPVYYKEDPSRPGVKNERFIEMKGRLLPLRNIKHNGKGVLYEVFDNKNPQNKGYAIEWSGAYWIFENPTNKHIKPDLEKIILENAIIEDIDISLLSMPDSYGFRSDSEGNKYLKTDGGFVNVSEDNAFFIRGKDDNKIYLKLDAGSISLADPNRYKRKEEHATQSGQTKNKCISGVVIYEGMDHLSAKNKVTSTRHRADFNENVPENGSQAFIQSLKNCRVAIETDVMTTKDGELVIFHDRRIGKMMEPDYNPNTNKGPNEELAKMTLAELKQKKLLNPNREVTEDTILTVQELIELYVSQEGQSQIYLEVKDPKAIIRVAKVIADKAETHPHLLDRLIVKFNMAEYATPDLWLKALRKNGIKKVVMANPVISPNAASRINAMDYKIPDPKNEKLFDNASRAVYAWSATSALFVPNVEVVIKSSASGFIDTESRTSVQGRYDAPTSLDIANTVPGSAAYFVAIVKKNGKPLGTYVPVADKVMWSKGIITGTVPSVKNPHKSLASTEAYNTDTEGCCYSLEEILAANENNDTRKNLAWNFAIGANVITSDDTDSIDTYYDKMGQLDKELMPVTRYPLQEMHSSLAWDLGFYERPIFSEVNIKAWGGSSSAFWGGQVCLWDNPYSNYPWTYTCEATPLMSYYKNLQIRTVETADFGKAIQIYSHDKDFCMAVDDEKNYAIFTPDCASSRTATHFHLTRDNYMRSLYFGKENKYMTMQYSNLYLGKMYGTIGYTNVPTSWSQWSFVPAEK